MYKVQRETMHDLNHNKNNNNKSKEKNVTLAGVPVPFLKLHEMRARPTQESPAAGGRPERRGAVSRGVRTRPSSGPALAQHQPGAHGPTHTDKMSHWSVP